MKSRHFTYRLMKDQKLLVSLKSFVRSWHSSCLTVVDFIFRTFVCQIIKEAVVSAKIQDESKVEKING